MIKLSVLRGNIIELLGLTTGILVLFLVPPLPSELLLWSWFSLWYFSHCPTHYVVGTLLGVSFTHYVVGHSNLTRLNGRAMREIVRLLPTLGLRIDKTGGVQSSPRRRAALYASGAVASMLLPLFPTVFSFHVGNTTVQILLTLMTLGNLALTLYASPRTGDLARAKKSWRFAPANT